MLQWINNRYDTNFKEKEISEVKNFALIWNIFEGTVCGSHFSTQKVEQKIKELKIDVQDFHSQIQYFKNRYVTDGELNHRFEYLYLRKNDRPELIKKVLLDTNTAPDDVILAITIIIYRYRNNLFHGIKQMQTINLQNENFQIANKVLQIFLNYCD